MRVDLMTNSRMREVQWEDDDPWASKPRGAIYAPIPGRHLKRFRVVERIVEITVAVCVAALGYAVLVSL